MVLEDLVSSVLNRVLGQYIENVDPKRMQMGIWNGLISCVIHFHLSY